MFTQPYLAIGALLSTIVAAVPTAEVIPHELAPRCVTGTSQKPSKTYILHESQPNLFDPKNDLSFVVSQKKKPSGGVYDRLYTLVHFDVTPAGSYGCQLHFSLPKKINGDFKGKSQLDVKTVKDFPPGFKPTWKNVVNSNPSILGSGVFGTVNAVAGVNSVVNTKQCSNKPKGTGLNFLFKFSDWVEQGGYPSVAAFLEGGNQWNWAGVYLNYDC